MADTNLNLITDAWIPAMRGKKSTDIRPDQIAEPDVTALNWPRADFNLACLELLIGLVSLADPPKDDDAWLDCYSQPNQERLRNALASFSQHFNLSGPGARFLQDFEAFENETKPEIKPVEALLIDSAGNQGIKKNADLMVKRGRFPQLSMSLAAMALYTLQAFAPAGGKGNLTSMRGGGPMTTLVCPSPKKKQSLWQLVFANVQPIKGLKPKEAEKALPWLRPTRKGEVTPGDSHQLEAFFGMPRRLRLIFEDNQVVGFIQKPYGTKYSKWQHPLTPYYRKKEDDAEWFAVHPKAGRLSYRNWRGITLSPTDKLSKTLRIAESVRLYHNQYSQHIKDIPQIMAGGWEMDNMKPVDFSLDLYPYFSDLNLKDKKAINRIENLVEAAVSTSSNLRKALKEACQVEGTASSLTIESFFLDTEEKFISFVRKVIGGEDNAVEEKWLEFLKKKAIAIFDKHARDGISECSMSAIEKRVKERRILLGKMRKIRSVLGLEEAKIDNKQKKP